MGSVRYSCRWHLYGNAGHIDCQHQPSDHRALFWRPTEWRYRMGDYRIPHGHCRGASDCGTPGRHDWSQTDMDYRLDYFHSRLGHLWRLRLTWHVDRCASVAGPGRCVHYGCEPGYAHQCFPSGRARAGAWNERRDCSAWCKRRANTWWFHHRSFYVALDFLCERSYWHYWCDRVLACIERARAPGPGTFDPLGAV